jgi:hypothetical protein
MKWPPDYTAEYKKRAKRIALLKKDPSLIIGAKEYYKNNPIAFINDWCITYDPRNVGTETPAIMPFILFPRQEDVVNFVYSCLRDKENGLMEKCRTFGATWLACGISTHLFLFEPGAAIGFGSNKAEKVDKLGNPDSILEKVRMIIDYMPRFFWPDGFDPKKHATYMRLINPENGASITGEGGVNIGRGGRKLVYFLDEAAHIEHADRVESALSETTNVQIALSSVFGTSNIFYRRRHAGEVWEPGTDVTPGKTRVLILDWREHPHMTQEWYDKKRARAEEEGLLHLFAQEIDRDYASAVEGVVIKNAWIKSAIDAHLKLDFSDDGMLLSGLDVADEGGDKDAYVQRSGVILKKACMWGQGDTGVTARKALTYMKESGVKVVQYDCIGVGAGVKAEYNRLNKEGLLKDEVFVPWSASASPLNKKGRVIKGDKNTPRNKDFYSNLKAQGWWQLRNRFEKTHRAVTGEAEYDVSELISIPSKLEYRHVVEQELSQPTYSTNGRGQIVIDKKPPGTKSPNIADAIVMCYWPVKQRKVLI